jgi:hypothetical protein
MFMIAKVWIFKNFPCSVCIIKIIRLSSRVPSKFLVIKINEIALSVKDNLYVSVIWSLIEFFSNL